MGSSNPLPSWTEPIITAANPTGYIGTVAANNLAHGNTSTGATDNALSAAAIQAGDNLSNGRVSERLAGDIPAQDAPPSPPIPETIQQPDAQQRLRRRQQQIGAGVGFSDLILTSPLGLPGDLPANRSKTKLGG